MEMERNENVWCVPPPPEMSHFQMNVHHEVAVAVVLGVRIHSQLYHVPAVRWRIESIFKGSPCLACRICRLALNLSA